MAGIAKGIGDAATDAVKKKGIFGTGAKVAGGATVIGAIGGTGYFMASDGTFYDAAGNLVEDINKALGEAQARAGAQIGAESLYAVLEQIGVFMNNVFGGETGVGFINWARDAQGVEQVVATSEGLVEKSKVDTASNTQTANASVTGVTTANAATYQPTNTTADLDLGDLELGEFQTAFAGAIGRHGRQESNPGHVQAATIEALEAVSPSMSDEFQEIFNTPELASAFNQLPGMSSSPVSAVTNAVATVHENITLGGDLKTAMTAAKLG